MTREEYTAGDLRDGESRDVNGNVVPIPVDAARPTSSSGTRCPWCGDADLVASGGNLWCPEDGCEFVEQGGAR